MRERSCAGAAALAALAIVACSTDTSALVRRSPTGGSAGVGGSGTTGGEAGDGAGGAAAGGGGDPPELAGTGAIGVVHGLLDGGVLFVCASDRESGASITGEQAQPPGGLPYAGVFELPTGWNLETADVELSLFVASGVMWTSPSCAELVASAVDPLAAGPSPDAGSSDAGAVPPPFPLEPTLPRRAGSVRLAPGSLTSGAHYALIAAGCTSPGASEQVAVCGEPDPFGSAQALVLVQISSEPVAGDDRLGLQFVNASRVIDRADLTLENDRQQAPAPLGSDVPFGVVRPFRAAAVAEPVGVELHVRREPLPSYTQAWVDTPGASAATVLGHNHLLAYVGPLPPINVLGLNPPRFVLVRGR